VTLTISDSLIAAKRTGSYIGAVYQTVYRGEKLMLKKALFAAILALSFVAAVGTQASIPPPQCNPCPYVN